MSPRVYERKFDWDEARQRHAAGETLVSIATDYGVSPTAVWRACNPAAYERMKQQSSQWQKGGICPCCGGAASRTAGKPQKLCWTCRSLLSTTTAREDTLRCVTCHKWKPDDAFPMVGGRRCQIGRRGRHRQCTLCNTIAKREWRKKAGRW